MCVTCTQIYTRPYEQKTFRAYTSKYVDVISGSPLNAVQGGTKTCHAYAVVIRMQSYTHHEVKEVKDTKIFS